MANNKRKDGKSGRLSVQELVTVAFAEDLDLARQNKKLLEDNGIPAQIKEPSDPSRAPGIAVLVREEDLDQAHALIASHASFEEFFDVFFHGSDRLLEDGLDEEIG